MSHLYVSSVEVLLRHGADPRLYAEDGQTPAQVCTFEAVKELIDTWDLARTETLLEKLETSRAAQKEQDRQRLEMETGRLDVQIKKADEDYQFKQKKVNNRYFVNHYEG